MASPLLTDPHSALSREGAKTQPVLDSRQSSNHHRVRLVLRLGISAGLIVALLKGCLWLPNIDHATVALLLIAATVGIAAVWGSAEALTGALVGGIGFDYFFLPPHGFGIAKPEHWVALAVFVFVASAIGQLAARSKSLLAQRNSLLRLSLDPLCVADLNGNFRNVNQAMVDLLGWPEEELTSRPLFELLHPDDVAQTRDAFRGFFETGSTVEVENRYQTKDGGWRWLHWKIAPPAQGESWLSAAARDVTEERWAREKLRDLAGQVMTAQEEERRRIASELHDDATQRLATVGIELGLLRKNPPPAADLAGEFTRMQGQIVELSEYIRRLSHSLHPSILEHGDLASSLEAHCREFSGQYNIAASFSARDLPESIPRPVTLALYRIAQESLRNVARHSGATEAAVVLTGADSAVCLSVIDNGKGFDPAQARTSPGLGLVSIEERARQVGGLVTIESIADAGTTLSVRVPIL